MTTISILRAQLHHARSSLITKARVKATKLGHDLKAEMDAVTATGDMEKMTPALRDLLDTRWHDAFRNWSNNLELLRREEKKGWA